MGGSVSNDCGSMHARGVVSCGSDERSHPESVAHGNNRRGFAYVDADSCDDRQHPARTLGGTDACAESGGQTGVNRDVVPAVQTGGNIGSEDLYAC